MHDLVETGRKIFDAITKQKPADAGDLAQGIERIIEELRSDPDQFKDKLDHLEGLFKELVYGEEYVLREEATEKPEDFIWASGVMPTQQTFNFPISGAISGVVTPLPSPPMPMPPTTGINNPCGEIPLGEPEECSLPAPEPEEKPKKPWWKFWGGSNE